MELIAALPDPSEPEFVPFSAALVAFLATAGARFRGVSRSDRQGAAFEGAFVGTGLGLAIYVGGLLIGLT